MEIKVKIDNKDLTKFYTWGVKLLIFVIPILSLYISRSLFFPFITGRNFAFRILVEISFALWLGLVVLDKRYRPRLSKIGTALLIFLAVVGLADLLGVDPYHSFWSRFERMEGYLAFIHLFLYFVILSTVLKTKRDWFILFNIFLVAGSINGIYGMMQKFGFVEESIQGGIRPDGYIGNPSYLAAYLVLALVLCFVLLLNSRQRWQTYLYSGIASFFVFVIYSTATRGSSLALLIASFLFLVIYFVFSFNKIKDKKIKLILGGSITLLVILPLSLWLLRDTQIVKRSEILSRLASISLSDKTTKARFMIWNMSWQGFKERPILGWGQENYIQVFSKYYDPRLFDQEPWFDRAHNLVFDWLINAGALGLLSFMGIFTSAILVIISLIKRKIILLKEGLLIFVAFLAYLLQNFFVFDNFNSYILVFSLLAYVNSLDMSDSEEKAPKFLNAGVSSLMIFGLSLGLISFAVYFLNVKPIMQAKGIIDSLRATASKVSPVETALASFEKTLGYNTFGEVETLEQFTRTANLLVGQDFETEQKKKFIKTVAGKVEDYLERFPNDIRLHLMLAELYAKARNLDPGYLGKSREHLLRAMELSPKRQTIYSFLAESYLSDKEYDKAIEILNEAAALNPQNNEIYENIGIVGIYMDRNDIVKGAIAEIVKLNDLHGGIFTGSLASIGDGYIRLQKFDKARDVYEVVISYVPNNAQFRAKLAGLYLNQGMFEEAIEQARKAAELDPDEFSDMAAEFESNILQYMMQPGNNEQ